MTTQECRHQASLEKWKERVAECRSSGLTVRAWCAENHVSTYTYYRWEREVISVSSNSLMVQNKVSTEVSTGNFVQVPPAVAEQTAVPCSAAAILQAGNIRVMINSGADAGVVRTIIEALKSC